MTWLAWRQFRANAALAAVVTGAIAVTLIVTHGHVAHVADADKLSSGYKSLRLLGTVLIGVPAFIGAFWGAPLVAHELETGTQRLAWTQSVTRQRWLTIKLVVVGLGAVAVTGLFSLLFTWWSLPFDGNGGRLGTANFGQRGVAPIAYALFAVALGALAGTILRRTLPAMAAALAAFAVVRFAFQLWVRPHLLGTVTATLPNNLFGQREGDSAAGGGWILSSRTVDAAGHGFTGTQIDDIIRHSCRVTRETTTGDLGRCADRLGFHDIVRMHPASQFWPLQTWESACFLALAAIATAVCFWWLRHRTA